MDFCGQCGYRLAPGNTRCPRCGSVTDVDISAGDPHLYDPTMVIPPTPNVGPLTPQPETQLSEGNYFVSPTPPQQQKLVLRSNDSGPGSGSQTASDPNRQMTVQEPLSPFNPNRGASYPGYPPQSGGNYVSPATSYPSFMPAPEYAYQQAPGQIGDLTPRGSRGRGMGLLIGLLVLLLILGSVAGFFIIPGFLKGLHGNNAATPGAGTTAAPTLTTADHAHTVIQQYYADINNKDYQSAYNLWGSDFQNSYSYDKFAAGYAHTMHDDVTINSLTTNADGTVTTRITLVALEDTVNGQVTSTYQGTYIIGQENGTWKFLSGTLTKVS